MALLCSTTLGNLKIFTKAPKSNCKFPGRQESKLQLALLNKKGNGGRKETLDDSEASSDSATTGHQQLVPEATSFANKGTGPMGCMRSLTLGEGLTGDEWRGGRSAALHRLPAQIHCVVCPLTPTLTLHPQSPQGSRRSDCSGNFWGESTIIWRISGACPLSSQSLSTEKLLLNVMTHV